MDGMWGATDVTSTRLNTSQESDSSPSVNTANVE